MLDFTTINFLACFVASLAAFALGALWYSPVLFGKVWQRELGFTDEYLREGNMASIFGTSFALMFVMAVALAVLLGAIHVDGFTVGQGAELGLFVGVFFAAAALAINVLYQRRSVELWMIDAGYQALFMVVEGLIIGAWG